MSLQPRTIVVVPGARLGEIVRRSSRGRARGYDVLHADQDHDRTLGFAPHFIEEHAVAAAAVGVNVCAEPRGWCRCGRVHASPEMLARLPRGGLG